MPQQYRNVALDVVRASATAALTVQIRDGICNYTRRALTESTARRNNEILLEARREHITYESCRDKTYRRGWDACAEAHYWCLSALVACPGILSHLVHLDGRVVLGVLERVGSQDPVEMRNEGGKAACNARAPEIDTRATADTVVP